MSMHVHSFRFDDPHHEQQVSRSIHGPVTRTLIQVTRGVEIQATLHAKNDLEMKALSERLAGLLANRYSLVEVLECGVQALKAREAVSKAVE